MTDSSAVSGNVSITDRQVFPLLPLLFWRQTMRRPDGRLHSTSQNLIFGWRVDRFTGLSLTSVSDAAEDGERYRARSSPVAMKRPVGKTRAGRRRDAQHPHGSTIRYTAASEAHRRNQTRCPRKHDPAPASPLSSSKSPKTVSLLIADLLQTNSTWALGQQGYAAESTFASA